jgi:hypothetical protein
MHYHRNGYKDHLALLTSFLVHYNNCSWHQLLLTLPLGLCLY